MKQNLSQRETRVPRGSNSQSPFSGPPDELRHSMIFAVLGTCCSSVEDMEGKTRGMVICWVIFSGIGFKRTLTKNVDLMWNFSRKNDV